MVGVGLAAVVAFVVLAFAVGLVAREGWRVETEVWRAHAEGGRIGVVYAASRPWLSAERGEVNASRQVLGLPPL